MKVCSRSVSGACSVDKDMYLLRNMAGRCCRITGYGILVSVIFVVILSLGLSLKQYTFLQMGSDTHMIFLTYDETRKLNNTLKLTLSRFPAHEQSTNNTIKTFNNNLEHTLSGQHTIESGSNIKPDSVFVPHTQEADSPVYPETEVRHIGFLKVHKAASSTMQNMFFRFGLKRNLTFVFTQHPNYFSRSSNNHLQLAKPKYRNGYDVLCNHGVFNYKIYSSLLPTDTVYIAIVRDPLAVFISAVNYYSQKSQRIDYIARVPDNRLQNLIQKPERYDNLFFSYTKNSMARDFGFPVSNDNSRIQAKLSELDITFKLILLVEYFEESLILMKRYLNWKLQDIMFLSNNVYVNGSSTSRMSDLTHADIQQFKIRNKLDYDVYGFFLEKFWNQFHSEPESINLELSHFKNVLNDVNMFCNNRTSGKEHTSENRFTIKQSKWTEQFQVTLDDCTFMNMDELDFISILRQKQGSELRR